MSAGHKSESPLAGGLRNTNQNTNDEIIGQDKALSNLRACFALAGFEMHQLSDGFVVCKWNLSKHCPDLRSLAAFAKQVGAV